MLATAQEAEDFAASRIGDGPKYCLALLWFQVGHINEFYVTIRLRICNRTVTQSQSLRRSASVNSRPHFRPQDSSLRVKSRHVQRKRACPLYPQNGHWADLRRTQQRAAG